MRLFYFFIALHMYAGAVSAASTKDSMAIQIIPQPNSIEKLPGKFAIRSGITIFYRDEATRITANYLAEYFSRYYNVSIPTKKSSTNIDGAINLVTHSNVVKNEAYTLTVTPSHILISGSSHGIFNGVQTLIQLLPVSDQAAIEVPAVVISDKPRFSYRGMMLDCGRHFFDTAFIKKFLDVMAFHKMNIFHWHLTDDQGWRIEIKAYPELTSIGAWRDSTLSGDLYKTPKVYDQNKYGGFYTQEQIRDIVKYAAERQITIIPEIEMPGHATAALATFPWLACAENSYHVKTEWGVSKEVFCPTNRTFTFLEQVLKEVITLFPGKYIHVGGDECPKDRWKQSPACQALIREKGLKDEEELQNYFMFHIYQFLTRNHKKMIAWAWDGMLDGKYAAHKDVTIMHWQTEKETGALAAHKGYAIINVPGAYTYFDYGQWKGTDSLNMGGYLTLSQVYAFKPAEISHAADTISGNFIGSQGNVWTEYMKWPTKVEYMMLPRMSALSEVLWSNKNNLPDFLKRVHQQEQRYILWGLNYHKKSLNLVEDQK